MGISASSHATARQLGGTTNFIPISAKVVGLDGGLEEFRRRTTTAEVVSGHPDCYLCSSVAIAINSTAPQLAKDYILQFGQIYFLMPLSKSLTPLSLQDMCVLAIKASIAMGNNSAPLMGGYTRSSTFKGSISGRFRVRRPSLRVFKLCWKSSIQKNIINLSKLSSTRKL